jgi:hypothetical protein
MVLFDLNGTQELLDLTRYLNIYYNSNKAQSKYLSVSYILNRVKHCLPRKKQPGFIYEDIKDLCSALSEYRSLVGEIYNKKRIRE